MPSRTWTQKTLELVLSVDSAPASSTQLTGEVHNVRRAVRRASPSVSSSSGPASASTVDVVVQQSDPSFPAHLCRPFAPSHRNAEPAFLTASLDHVHVAAYREGGGQHFFLVGGGRVVDEHLPVSCRLAQADCCTELLLRSDAACPPTRGSRSADGAYQNDIAGHPASGRRSVDFAAGPYAGADLCSRSVTVRIIERPPAPAPGPPRRVRDCPSKVGVTASTAWTFSSRSSVASTAQANDQRRDHDRRDPDPVSHGGPSTSSSPVARVDQRAVSPRPSNVHQPHR